MIYEWDVINCEENKICLYFSVDTLWVCSSKKADDRVMSLVLNEVQNEDKSIVQWKDEC